MLKRLPKGLRRMTRMLRRGYTAGRASVSCCQRMPQRQDQLDSLQEESFDVLVIGGGAIGCGCALEATTRGFKTALIEAGDFGSGASSKSSKLIEGSNSLLHAAIQGAELEEIYMLQQLLKERATMLSIAPHLNRVQPMLMPIYSPLRLPVYWLGLKMYDAMAGKANLRGSHFLSKESTLWEFPLLRKEGLLGSLVYYDVQQDDARMCLALAMTAIMNGASVVNNARLMCFLPRDSDEVCRRVRVKDLLRNVSFIINTRAIINATGAEIDVIRSLDDCKSKPIALQRWETHIALPRYYGSSSYGLYCPEQSVMIMPFGSSTLVSSKLLDKPDQLETLSADEVRNLIQQTQSVFDSCVQVQPDQVMSAWTEVETAFKLDDNEESNCILEISGNQMISLAGGSWNTYRMMASDAIEAAILTCQLEPQSKASVTENLFLDGADDYSYMLPLDLVQKYNLPMDVAQHLADTYGSNAYEMLSKTSCCDRRRLHQNFPYIEAEVGYVCQREYAYHLVDVIARRLRVAFVDAAAAAKMLPTILGIMAEQLCWKPHVQKRELKAAYQFLRDQMGLGEIVQKRAHPCSSTRNTLQKEALRLSLKHQDAISNVKHSSVGTSRLSCQAFGVSPTGNTSNADIVASLGSNENGFLHSQSSPTDYRTGMMYTTDSSASESKGPQISQRIYKKPKAQKPPTISFSPYVIAGTGPIDLDDASKRDKQVEEPSKQQSSKRTNAAFSAYPLGKNYSTKSNHVNKNNMESKSLGFKNDRDMYLATNFRPVKKNYKLPADTKTVPSNDHGNRVILFGRSGNNIYVKTNPKGSDPKSPI